MASGGRKPGEPVIPEPGSAVARLSLPPVKRAGDLPVQPAAGDRGETSLVKGADQEEGRDICPTSPGPLLNKSRRTLGLEMFSPQARGAGGVATIPFYGHRLSISRSTPALGIHPHLLGLGVKALLHDIALVFGDALLDGHLLIPLIGRLVPQKTLLGIGVGAD